LYTLVSQPGRERSGVGKALRIPGEDTVAVHVVNVEMKNVQRQVIGAIAGDNLLGDLVREIAPAALLIAQRPLRGHGQMAGQIGVTAQDSADRGAPEEVVIHLAAVGGEDDGTLQIGAEIEMSAKAVVEEDAVGSAVLPADVEGDALVDGIGAFVIGGRVGVPHGELAAALVETRGLLAEAVEVLFEAQALGGGDGAG